MLSPRKMSGFEAAIDLLLVRLRILREVNPEMEVSELLKRIDMEDIDKLCAQDLKEEKEECIIINVSEERFERVNYERFS